MNRKTKNIPTLEELSIITDAFYYNDQIKEILTKAINETWKNINYKKMDEDIVYGIIVMTFVNHLTKNECQRFDELYVFSDKEGIVLSEPIKTEFIVYLSKHKGCKDELETLFDVLMNANTKNTLERKKHLNKFIWKDETRYDAVIENKINEIINKYKIPIEQNEFKKGLHKALCVHPEKILERYDFSDKLDNWCDKTIKQAISLISDIFLIDGLLKQNKNLIDIMFHSDNNYKNTIDEALIKAWDLKDKDLYFTAVIDTFVYYLVSKDNGEQLKYLKRCIYKQVPYIPLPYGSYSDNSQEKWERFELDTSLLNLLYKSAYSFFATKDCRKNKDERKILYELLYKYNDQQRKAFIMGSESNNYDKKIDEVCKHLKESYKKQIIETHKIKTKLQGFLCAKDTLVKYDFSKGIKVWYDQIAERVIESYPILELLLNDNDGSNLNTFIYNDMHERLSYLANNYKRYYFRTSYDNSRYTSARVQVESVDDLSQELVYILLRDDKKLLKDFKYDSKLSNHVIKIAKHHILKIANSQKPNPSTKKIIKNEDNYIITYRDISNTCGKYITLLRDPEIKNYFGFGRRSKEVYDNQLYIIEYLFVNLQNSKEIKAKRKELIEHFTSNGLAGEPYLRSNEKRAKEMLATADKIIQKLERKPRGKLSETEIKILSISSGFQS